MSFNLLFESNDYRDCPLNGRSENIDQPKVQRRVPGKYNLPKRVWNQFTSYSIRPLLDRCP